MAASAEEGDTLLAKSSVRDHKKTGHSSSFPRKKTEGRYPQKDRESCRKESAQLCTPRAVLAGGRRADKSLEQPGNESSLSRRKGRWRGGKKRFVKQKKRGRHSLEKTLVIPLREKRGGDHHVHRFPKTKREEEAH